MNLFGGEDRLAKVVGDVAGAAEEDGEAVAMRLFGEVFFGDRGVAFEPLGWRGAVECGQELFVDCAPGGGEFSGGRVRICAVGRFDEDGFELGVEGSAEAEQREHSVVDGGEVSPEIDEAIFAGGD